MDYWYRFGDFLLSVSKGSSFVKNVIQLELVFELIEKTVMVVATGAIDQYLLEALSFNLIGLNIHPEFRVVFYNYVGYYVVIGCTRNIFAFHFKPLFNPFRVCITQLAARFLS